jgi:hypothetical protein
MNGRNKKTAYRNFVPKPEGSVGSWTSSHRWEDNIRVDLKVRNKTGSYRLGLYNT